MAEEADKKTVPRRGDADFQAAGDVAAGPAPPAASVVVAVLLLSVLAALLASMFTINSFGFLVVAVAALVASYRWPRVALFVFLVYTSTIIAPEYFSLWVDTNLVYWAAELFLLVIVFGAIVQRVREGAGAFHDFVTSPVAVSLAVLGLVISVKSFVFLVETRFPQWAFNHVYTFNRSLGFLALFVPVYLLFNTEKRQKLFLAVIFVMGGVIAGRVILEAVFPDLGIFAWIGLRQSLAVEFPSVDPTILRLRAPGGALVQVCFWMGLMNIILRDWTPRRMALYVPLTALMLTAILLEFNRSYVIPIAALAGLAMLLNRRGVRLKLAAILAIFVMILVSLSLITGTVSDYVTAFSERYGSAFAEETFKTQSLNSRKIENEYSWESIRSAPVFGIGINEYYRPPVAGMLDNLRWYIHDAYLWYWVYFGFIGLAALLVALAVAVARGLFNWGKVEDPFLQAGVLALVFTLLTLSVASFYAPRFYEYGTVPVVALIVGMIEAIVSRARKAREREAQALAGGARAGHKP